ncbi:hypothetical protein [Salirhabdus salicampi]|uniref:hypothetical protein n=1 Tax=Salirhabdus salicampi TaxID=476102 RepID=UPI0020C3F8EC|nr:hypothetical protein [Salirhabdus salicampi]MCP8616376.1 hypothetical protein [Salirhabdus salicampi]
MNSVTLAESLLVMNKESLRFYYTLVHDSNIVKMLIPFAKEKMNKSGKSEIMEMVNKKTNKYKYTPNSHLHKMLLREFEDLYKIPYRKLYTKQDAADQWDRIINAMYYEMKKKNKKFAAYTCNENTPIEQIIKFQMHNLIESIEDQELTDEQLHQIGDSLEKFLQELPEKQQKQIAEKLGINEITSSSIRQLIVTNGSAVVFVAIVQVAGFAFYTTLTTIIAGIFGLIGITLPFTVYATLTSAVAVIANPLFVIPTLLIGGGGVLKWQNNKLRQAIAPVVIMQIMLGANPTMKPDWEAFLDG